VGLRVLLAAAERHDVWVLTRQNSVSSVESFLTDHRCRDRIRLHGLDVDGPLRRVKRAGLPGLHVYYDTWQRLAARAAAELDREVDFDLVHHATFATYWTRAGVARLRKPFVWGPVGGGVSTPALLVPELGPAGLREESLREAVRRLAVLRPSQRATVRAATVCLAQNPSTARRVGGDHVRVLPNALTVDLGQLGPPEPRRPEIAMVGRLVAWKGGHLALRALRHVRHPTAVLRFFGDGPDRERLRIAADRWGLRDRVDLVGSLPRDELISRVRRCTVVLHTALHDESPVALGEALSLGVPVVCLDHGGPAEIVRWWPAASFRLVRPGTPEATARRLAAAVDAALDDAPDPPAEAVRPSASFDSLLLDAYEQAVRQAGAPSGTARRSPAAGPVRPS
jgi:glycosyltransferase involved in cell wall biosynthesis